jgi:hypothetical protein
MENNSFKIYKGKCNSCQESTFTKLLFYECQMCWNFCEEVQEIKNPVGEVKPRHFIITKSFGTLTPDQYSNQDILHVGISDSKSRVFNFWDSYKIQDRSENQIWKKVINVELPLIELDDFLFDQMLEEDMNFQKQKFPKYHQINNNCYDYVCRMLNNINYGNKEWTKQTLAFLLVEPAIIYLEKYFSLYKDLFQSSKNIDFIKEDNREYSQSICDNCSQRIFMGERFHCLTCQDYDMCKSCYSQFNHDHKMENM